MEENQNNQNNSNKEPQKKSSLQEEVQGAVQELTQNNSAEDKNAEEGSAQEKEPMQKTSPPTSLPVEPLQLQEKPKEENNLPKDPFFSAPKENLQPKLKAEPPKPETSNKAGDETPLKAPTERKIDNLASALNEPLSEKTAQPQAEKENVSGNLKSELKPSSETISEKAPEQKPEKTPPDSLKESGTEEESGEIGKVGEIKESSVRTYATDIAKLVKKGTSLSDVALSEQKRKLSGGGKPNIPPKKDSRNRKIIIAASVFVILGIIFSVVAFIFRTGKEAPAIEAEIPSIVFSNNNQELSIAGLDKEDIFKKINGARENIQGSLGSIINLYVTAEEAGAKRIASSESFLGAIDVRARGSFLRSLNDTFMLGVHVFDGNQSFLIFNINSFENALSGILDWEDNMLDDLWPIFYGSKPSIQGGATSTARVFNKAFEDIIIRNRDARALKSESGEMVLVYSFPDRNHLVITTEESTLFEIFDRLTTDRFRN